MTENKAIQIIKREEQWESNASISKAFNMATQALEEIQQYRAIGTPEQILASFNDGADTLEQSKEVIEAFMHKIEEYEAIGTVEECRVAVEKQRAKKPNDYQIDDEYDSGYCPCCGKAVYDDGGGYCPYCGQKLEWDEEE